MVVSEIAPQTAFPGDTVAVDVSTAFRDPDGDALTFTAVASDSSVVGVSVSESHVTMVGLSRGSAVVTVTVRDPHGAEAGQSFEVTVPNRGPAVAEAIGPRTVFLGETAVVDLSGAFSDPDGDALTFEATSSDTTVVRVRASESEVTLETASRGVATVTVTARDPAGGEAGQSFEVTVPNRGPAVAEAIGPRTVFLGETAVVDLSGAFSDPDGDALTFEATSSDTAVVRVRASESEVTLETASRGVATVTVTARDPAGGEAGQSFEVTVPNRGPAVAEAIGPRTVFLGETAVVDLSGAFSDPDGDALTFEATSSDTAVVRVRASESEVTLETASRGVATVTVTARDPAGGEAGQSFEVTVPNRGPAVAEAIGPRTVFLGETAVVDLSGAFSDPDGDALTFEATSSDTAVVRVRASESEVTLETASRGVATVTVTARDPAGTEAGQSFEVTVPNRAPVVADQLPADTVFLGETLTLNMFTAFTDPDGDTLTFEAASSDTAAVLASAAGSDVTLEGAGRGAATVTVTARDPDGAEVSQSFEMAVPNRAPAVASEFLPLTLFPAATVTVDVSASFSDPDGDSLTFLASSSDTGVVAAAVAAAALTMQGVSKGTATVTVTARDGHGGEVAQSMIVTVPNRSPVTTGSIPAQTVAEGETTTVDVSPYFRDPDDDSLSFGAFSSNAAYAGVSVSGSAVTIEGVAAGSGSVTVTARDPDGGEARQSFGVTVWQSRPPNQAPVVVSAIPAQIVAEGESVSVTLDDYFSDPEGGSLNYGATSSNEGVATTSISGSAVVVEGVSEGTATVTVTATDPGGLSARQQFGVTVERAPGNRAPVVVSAIPAQIVAEGESVSVTLDDYFSDPEGGSLNYGATSSNEGVATTSISGSAVVVEGVSEGTATVTVTATDPGGLSARQQFGVTVGRAPGNRAPEVVSAIPAQIVAEGESVSVTLDDYFSDPEGGSLNYGATSSNEGVATTSISGSAVVVEGVSEGTATVTVTATDPGGLSARQQFGVTVERAPGNRAPVVVSAIPAQIVAEGESVSVTLDDYFSDPEGGSLNYGATSSNEGVATTSISGSAVVVEGVSEGTATVTVTATDPGGLSARQQFGVTVERAPGNRAPVVVSAIPAQIVAEGESVSVTLDDYFSDPEGGSLNYGATSSNEGVATTSISGSAVVVEGVSEGTATVTVTATDPGGLSARQQFGVTVERAPGNRAPVVVSAIPAQIVAEGESVSVTLDDYFSDPEGGSLNYGATSSNEGVATTSISGSAVVVEGVSEGTATVTVTATDPGGLSARQQFGVTVERAPGNRAPVVVQGIPDRTLAVGKSFGGPAGPYFRDPDNDSLLYTATSSNPGAVTATTAHFPLFPPVFEVRAVTEGTAIITLTATDPEDLSVSLTFQVTAEILPNNPPVATQDLSDQTINVGQERTVVRNLHDYFSDPDGDRLGFSASSSDTSVLETGWSIVAGWWINGRSAGTVTVTVTATDEVGASVSQDVRVTVVELPNEAPIVTGAIPNQSMVVGETDSLSVGDLRGYFSDPDDDPLTFRARSSARGTVSVWIQETSLYMRAFLAGSVTVTVTATDPGLKNVSQEFTVTAEAEGSTSQAPEVTGTIADRTAIIGGELPVQTYRYFTDPDGDDANLAYTVETSNAAVATVRRTSPEVFYVTAVSDGSAGITVTAQDPGGADGLRVVHVHGREQRTSGEGCRAGRNFVAG